MPLGDSAVLLVCEFVCCQSVYVLFLSGLGLNRVPFFGSGRAGQFFLSQEGLIEGE